MRRCRKNFPDRHFHIGLSPDPVVSKMLPKLIHAITPPFMVLLNFDIEEFDLPMEYGAYLPFSEQMRISIEGTQAILHLLERHQIKATFFCTATFAINAADLIKTMVERGHEVASHGYYHSSFSNDDLAASKTALEQITGKPVTGFRMARMMPVNNKAVYRAGYLYNSPVNPAWIPDNHFSKPRGSIIEDQVILLPVSVTRLLRIPLFWLSFHNLPLWLYKLLCRTTYRADKYLNISFHSWEFTDLRDPQLGLPYYIRRNSGKQMIRRMDSLIRSLKAGKLSFSGIEYFLTGIPLS
jgi:peptidoglycan/xylan/chitin deacetylase (PgdA/CDA1 family)